MSDNCHACKCHPCLRNRACSRCGARRCDRCLHSHGALSLCLDCRRVVALDEADSETLAQLAPPPSWGAALVLLIVPWWLL